MFPSKLRHLGAPLNQPLKTLANPTKTQPAPTHLLPDDAGCTHTRVPIPLALNCTQCVKQSEAWLGSETLRNTGGAHLSDAQLQRKQWVRGSREEVGWALGHCQLVSLTPSIPVHTHCMPASLPSFNMELPHCLVETSLPFPVFHADGVLTVPKHNNAFAK